MCLVWDSGYMSSDITINECDLQCHEDEIYSDCKGKLKLNVIMQNTSFEKFFTSLVSTP